MQSHELREIRRRLGLSRLELARLIGYTGTDRNDEMRIRKMETRGQPPLHIARLVWMIHKYHLWFGEIPTFPAWAGYEFSHDPDPQHQKEKADALDR